MEKRIFLFDNIKGILIFLVVLGHVIEPLTGYKFLKITYLAIYGFHMPLFAFISGYFAKYDAKKAVKTLIYPYVIFQILYLLFARFVLKEETAFSFLAPYWILWYLMSLFFWKALIPFFETKSKKQAFVLFLLTLSVSLLAGFDRYAGYTLSLSRTLVFFPFFLLAYYINCFFKTEEIINLRENKRLKLVCLILIFISIIFVVIFKSRINPAWLHGSYSYKSLGYSLIIRAIILANAFVYILFFLLFTPKNEVKILTNTGKSCIFIYLIHGFIIKYYRTTPYYQNLYLILPITCAVVLILSDKYLKTAFSPLITVGGKPKWK